MHTPKSKLFVVMMGIHTVEVSNLNISTNTPFITVTACVLYLNMFSMSMYLFSLIQMYIAQTRGTVTTFMYLEE